MLWAASVAIIETTYLYGGIKRNFLHSTTYVKASSEAEAIGKITLQFQKLYPSGNYTFDIIVIEIPQVGEK